MEEVEKREEQEKRKVPAVVNFSVDGLPGRGDRWEREPSRTSMLRMVSDDSKEREDVDHLLPTAPAPETEEEAAQRRVRVVQLWEEDDKEQEVFQLLSLLLRPLFLSSLTTVCVLPGTEGFCLCWVPALIAFFSP